MTQHPEWTFLNPQADYSSLGYVPGFLDLDDPRPAAEQIESNYVSGWLPFSGFKLRGTFLKYPGDPTLKPLAETHLRDEHILFYPDSWLAIIQPDGSFEVARLD